MARYSSRSHVGAAALGEVDWKGGTKEFSLGNVPGRTAKGSCTLHGDGATYSYATMTPGGSKNILIIYAVKQSATTERKHEAQQSFRRI